MIVEKIPYGDDTGWINLSTYVDYRRKNGVVYVRLTTAPTVGTWVEHGTLPSEYRPMQNVYSCVYSMAYVYVGANGSVQTLADATQGQSIPAMISYPLN